MILYHGSNVDIKQINLDLCKPYKDFGKGFYTTKFEKQAENMAIRTVKQFGGIPTVTKFNIDELEFENPIIIKKIYLTPSDEWALFVINNRNSKFKDISNLNCNTDCKYDIVIGPVANDDIRLLFDLFEDNIITINELKSRLEYKELTNQISFHSKNAVKLLERENSYIL